MDLHLFVSKSVKGQGKDVQRELVIPLVMPHTLKMTTCGFLSRGHDPILTNFGCKRRRTKYGLG